jgi:hypothetical protein
MPNQTTDSRTFPDATERIVQLPGCKIAHAQLVKLIDTVTYGFAASEVTVSTERRGTRISRARLEDLMAAVEDSLLPGHAAEIDNLRMCVHSRGRNVRLSITPLMVTVRLYGTDCDWVRSREQEVRELLAETRPKRLVAKSTGRPNVGHSTIGGFIAGAFIGLLVAMLHILPRSAGHVGLLALVASLGTVVATATAVATRWYLRRSLVDLQFHPTARAERRFTISDIVASALAGAILIAAVAGILIAHRDATRSQSDGRAVRPTTSSTMPTRDPAG